MSTGIIISHFSVHCRTKTHQYLFGSVVFKELPSAAKTPVTSVPFTLTVFTLPDSTSRTNSVKVNDWVAFPLFRGMTVHKMTAMHMMTTQIIAVLTLEFICSSIIETPHSPYPIQSSAENTSTVYLLPTNCLFSDHAHLYSAL